MTIEKMLRDLHDMAQSINAAQAAPQKSKKIKQ